MCPFIAFTMRVDCDHILTFLKASYTPCEKKSLQNGSINMGHSALAPGYVTLDTATCGLVHSTP